MASGRTVGKMTTRVPTAVWLATLLLPLMVVGCQLGFEGRAAATPMPPATPLPPVPPSANTPTPLEEKLQSAPRSMELTKVIDGYLHVRYLPPCEIVPSPAEWVASIILTDLRSGSFILLNRNGTLKSSSKPDDKTDEGRAALEEALKDSSVMEQIVARPECPEIYRSVNVGEPRFCGGLDGWPEHDAENIGEPPMPKVGLSRDDPTRGTCMGNGWVGSYCWPMGGEGRSCEERDDWSELAGVENYGIIKGPRNAYVTVLDDEGNPGRVSRIRMFTIEEEGTLLKLGRVVTPGEEAYSLEAQEGETIIQFARPDIPEGLYLLIASYESPLGEVEYGFKVELKDRRIIE